MIDRLIDTIKRSIHFLFIFWKNNPIYLVCSIFYYVLSSMLLGGTAKVSLIVLIVYAISLIIGFSPLGEKILRLLNRVRPLETKRETEYLQPLFEEVYERAKEKCKSLRKIEICVIDNMTVNAMALGRRTVAVTKGAMQTFTEEELLKLYGVGKKVADCICLFALHHLQAFPVDTHINQALEKHYKQGFPKRRYQGFEGVLQQYIFYYELQGQSKA